jgi:hypothetical protein
VTIKAVAVLGDPGIGISFNPDQGGGNYETHIVVGIDSTVDPGFYEYTIEIDCHGEIRSVDFFIYVGTCPITEQGFVFSIAGATEEPFPDECTEEEGSPTPTETPSPSPTLTPTAPPTGGEQIIFADHNCSDEVDPVDSLFVLRDDAGLDTNTGDCPPMGSQQTLIATNGIIIGDVDCSGEENPVDSLKVLRFDAGLSVSQEEDCPEIGSEITIAR